MVTTHKYADGLKTADGLELHTAAEVAELLRVSRQAAYDMIADGRIPGVVRIGRLVRVERSALLAWIEAGGDGSDER